MRLQGQARGSTWVLLGSTCVLSRLQLVRAGWGKGGNKEAGGMRHLLRLGAWAGMATARYLQSSGRVVKSTPQLPRGSEYRPCELAAYVVATCSTRGSSVMCVLMTLCYNYLKRRLTS